MSSDDGLVMQLHIGSWRNHNPQLYARYGPDMGADIPIRGEFTKNLKALLDRFGNRSDMTLVLFNLDETTYSRELAPLAGHYPLLRLGPPWWFFDSWLGMTRFLDAVVETAGIYNLAGFNDDTRAYPSIPARHDVWRRVCADWLAGQLLRGFIDDEDAYGDDARPGLRPGQRHLPIGRMTMLKQLDRSDYPAKRRFSERIVQFGGGNFLRGFADWVVDVLNEETDFAGGVALVKATPGDYADLDAQGCLYTTYLLGILGGEFVEQTRVIGAVTRTIYPYNDFAAYLALARQPEIRFIFSNTTESGIVFAAEDKLDDEPPGSFPAKLTRFLYERYRCFSGAAEAGCIIIPTELIVDNATRLRDIILEYAARWRLEAGFADWIAEHNLFCNTLVDRIVSGFPQAKAAEIFARLGYEDRLLTMGERYHSWIIEAPPSLLDEFPADKTRTPLNVKVVADAAPYRTIKVRLLNGAHSAMAPLGILLGIESVREAMEHEVLAPLHSRLDLSGSDPVSNRCAAGRAGSLRA